MTRTSKEWLSAIQHDKKSYVSGKPYRYLNLPEFVLSRYRVTVVCPDHGSWECSAVAHLKSKCPGCGTAKMADSKKGKPSWRKFSLKEVIAKAKDIHKNIDYSKVVSYEGNTDIWKLRCLTHNVDYKIKLFTHLYDKARGCPDCRKNRVEETAYKQSKDKGWQWESQLKALNYKVLEHSGSHKPCVLKCPVHGKFRLAKAYYLSQGWSICPECRPGSSAPEQRLIEALRKAGYKVEVHRRDILGDLELDIYLPEFKVGIEVNGVYHHNTGVKARSYHADKQRRLAKEGILLFSFTDFELRSKPDVALSMINAKCGLSKNTAGARLTTVSYISNSKAKEFLNRNHLQGFCGAAFYLGVYISIEGRSKPLLASVASFGKPRFKGSGATWELIRFASLKNTHISGGLSKVIKHFRKENPGSIFSYANLRFGKGDAYRASGFTELGRSPPGYFWINKDGHQLSRYQTQRKDLPDLLTDYDEDMSEAENMKKHNYYQIWDCGNLRFILP